MRLPLKRRWIEKLAAIKEIQTDNGSKITLKLPVLTRWASLFYCFENLMCNKDSLKILAIRKDMKYSFDKRNQKNVPSDTFWAKIRVNLVIMAPIKKWITRVMMKELVRRYVHLHKFGKLLKKYYQIHWWKPWKIKFFSRLKRDGVCA